MKQPVISPTLSRRRLVAAGAALSPTVIACGAAQDTGAPKASTQPVTLRLNVRAGGDEALWKFLEPKLKEKQPNVSYAVEGFPGDFTGYLQKVTVLAASNQLGDVIYNTTTSGDRKSTRLNSSHGYISYAVFCLK